MTTVHVDRRHTAFFFFNHPATSEIYTLSLHDALPISSPSRRRRADSRGSCRLKSRPARRSATRDRKSTRLNSSHRCISYAVFCLKKKKNYLELPSHLIRYYHRITTAFYNTHLAHPFHS